MNRWATTLIPLLTLSLAAHSQAPALSAPTTLPIGTPMAIAIDTHLPMRVGLPLRAQLIYSIYANDNLALPEHTVVVGTITALHSNHQRRIRARLGGDFTPFHIPTVHFTQIILPDGSTLPFSSDLATDGAPIYRAVAPPRYEGSFIRREFHNGVTVLRNDLAIFIAPGKGDRFKQFIYGEIPYHPERIEKGTAWTIETTAPLVIPPLSAPTPPPTQEARKRHFWEVPAPVPSVPDNSPSKWTIQAYLDDPLSSETSKKGQIIKATVAEPIYNPDHSIAIPQGATLEGAVTQAKPSRRFGRSGNLNFSFRQLTLPGGKPQNVETTLTGADAGQALALSSEGQVKAPPQDKLSLPIFLALLASRPLDQDHHGAGNGLGKDGVGGAAGLGLLGAVIGLSGAPPNAVAGIGYYGAALAVYYRWIAHGKKITFARDTRIVVQTIARRSAAIQPDPDRKEQP